MASDCRFSMGDSEWSRDESEMESRYVATPDLHADRRMYDIPPHIETRQMLQSTNRSETNPEKSEKSPTGGKTTGGRNRKVPLCIKMYLVGLTTAFVALLCFVVYLVIQQRSIATQHETFEANLRNITSRATEVQKLRQQILATQDGQRVIMLSLYKQWDAPNPTSASTTVPPTGHNTSTAGCNVGHIRSNNLCFFIVKLTRKAESTESMVGCWAAKSGSRLASFRHQYIEKAISSVVSVGQYWIDGYRKSQVDGFKYSDGSPMNATWLAGGTGDCVSLVVTALASTRHKTPCYDPLPGYICQYKAS